MFRITFDCIAHGAVFKCWTDPFKDQLIPLENKFIKLDHKWHDIRYIRSLQRVARHARARKRYLNYLFIYFKSYLYMELTITAEKYMLVTPYMMMKILASDRLLKQ